MKPIILYNDIIKDPDKGSCLAVSLASILEIDISHVPRFQEMTRTTWKKAMHDWASNIDIEINLTHTIPPGYSIGIGIHKSGVHHAVVCLNGEFNFDPNGTNEFYDEHRYFISVNKKYCF